MMEIQRFGQNWVRSMWRVSVGNRHGFCAGAGKTEYALTEIQSAGWRLVRME